MSNRSASQQRRKAKQEKAAKKKASKKIAQPKPKQPVAPQSPSSANLATALRKSLLAHIRATEVPFAMVSSLTSEQVMIMKTAETTNYMRLSHQDMKETLPDNEWASLQAFINENPDQKIVIFQEDNSPVMSFAFDEDELGLADKDNKSNNPFNVLAQ